VDGQITITVLQVILALRSADNLKEVAHQANKIYEVSCSAPAVASIQPVTTTAMEQQIKELTKQVASLKGCLSRARKRDRPQSRARKKQEEGFYY